MTPEQARHIWAVLAVHPLAYGRAELVGAIDALARELDRHEAHELEAARQRAAAEMKEMT